MKIAILTRPTSNYVTFFTPPRYTQKQKTLRLRINIRLECFSLVIRSSIVDSLRSFNSAVLISQCSLWNFPEKICVNFNFSYRSKFVNLIGFEEIKTKCPTLTNSMTSSSKRSVELWFLLFFNRQFVLLSSPLFFDVFLFVACSQLRRQ